MNYLGLDVDDTQFHGNPPTGLQVLGSEAAECA